MTSEPEAVLVGWRGDAERELALELAARGVRVVVLGADERAIAEIVGEIAFGGGKARHVVGDPSVAADVRAAAARCRDVFGRLDAVRGAVDGRAAEGLVFGNGSSPVRP